MIVMTDKEFHDLNNYKKKIGKMSVEMANAKFHKGYSDDSDGYSFEDSIADLEFKRDILRGVDPIDALCDLQEKTLVYQLLNPNPNIYEQEEIFDYDEDY
jgi:hypothetical protein